VLGEEFANVFETFQRPFLDSAAIARDSSYYSLQRSQMKGTIPSIRQHLGAPGARCW